MKTTKATHTLDTREQRQAISSPIRMEIIGTFAAGIKLSVAEIAEHMGRPASAVYYHVRILEGVGLLQKVGSRPGTKRDEALYAPIAYKFLYPAVKEPDTAANAQKILATAFRMAEKDMAAAMTSPNTRSTGKYRNARALRLHCRIDKKTLAEMNKHLNAIEALLNKVAKETKDPQKNTEYLSLTLALMPLRGRK